MLVGIYVLSFLYLLVRQYYLLTYTWVYVLSIQSTNARTVADNAKFNAPMLASFGTDSVLQTY
jgi:hypothetical protein